MVIRRGMQRLGWMGGLLVLASVLTARGGLVFTIHVETERIGSPTYYTSGSSPMRKSSLAVTSVIYRFDIRATALAPELANVEWVVLAEGIDHRPEECARGQTTARFPRQGRRAVIETGRIGLPSNDRSAVSGGSFEAALYGYGIRLTVEQGKVLGEKYSPSGAQQAIQWKTGASAPAPAPTTTRPPVPMPVVY